MGEELANQDDVLQRINGQNMHLLEAGMEDIVNMERENMIKFQDIETQLNAVSNPEIDRDVFQAKEIIKANIQRSKVVQEQINEVKGLCHSILNHKPKVKNIVLEYKNKKTKKQGRKVTKSRKI